jgi:uncharacterized delta-60 repeat protein
LAGFVRSFVILGYCMRPREFDCWGILSRLSLFIFGLGLGSGQPLAAQEVWSAAISPTPQNLWGACFGAGQFVAVGEAGTIITSLDGQTWTPRASGTTKWLVGVVHAGGQFVAVGDAGTVLYSYDGIIWQSSVARLFDGLSNPLPVERLNVVRRILGQWVVLGEDAAYATAQRADWLRGNPHLMSGKWWRGLAFGKGLYVAAGHVGIAASSSIDALAYDFTSRTPGVHDLEAVIFARDQFLAVGAGGAALKSTDGMTWTGVNPGSTASLRGVAFLNNTFIAVGDGGVIATSVDGDTWTVRDSTATANFRAVAGSDGMAVAVGEYGVIVRSTATAKVPVVLESPIAQTATAGGNAVFRVRALGSQPLSYQWQVNGAAISGATSDTLALAHLQVAQSGVAYTVTVNNAAGSVTSAPAMLTVTPAPGPGIVDEPFRVSPAFTDSPTALLPLVDGRILVAGGRSGQLVRLLASGAPDQTFQTVAIDSVQRLALAPDGKIFVGGNFATVNGQPRAKLVRLSADGTIDSSFNAAATIANAPTGITDVAVEPDGGVVVANSTTRLARLLASGDVDPAFFPSAAPSGSSDLALSLVALQADGKIVAAGNRSLGLAYVCNVARFNADGTLDPGFTPSGAGYFPSALRVLADGKIAFAAYTFKVGLASNFGRHLRRYNPDGSVSFSSDLANMNREQVGFTVGWHAVQFHPDGRALVSSDFTHVDGVARGGVARLNADGTLDRSFHPGITPPEPVTQIAIAADGKMHLGGAFNVYNGVARPRLVRLNETATEGLHAPAVLSLRPAETIVKDGQLVTLRVAATGSGSLTYQWFRSQPFSDTLFQVTADPSLTLPASDGDAGNQRAPGADPGLFYTGLYYVKVVNVRGESVSAPVAITVDPPDPQITSQPTHVSVQSGRDLVLPILLNGYTNLYVGNYQWQHDGVALPQGTSNVLSLPAATPASAGTYTVTVHNIAGATITSAPIVVTIDDTSRFTNISTRAHVGPGEQSVIAGFVVDGLNNRTVLVRGIGPSLAKFGVTGTLANPLLILHGPAFPPNFAFAGSWSDTPSVTPALFASAGAFPLDAGSKDAAVLLTSLPPGNYTVQLSTAVPGDTGVGLIELYETDNLPDRIINLSTRAFVGTEASVTISGIAIRGPVTKKILVRAVGPTLSEFGVNSPLANPVVTLLDAQGIVLATNDDWQSQANAGDVVNAAASVGAFPLSPGSRDAALLIELLAGNYTAQVSGVGGATGIALLEIYEVPWRD